MDQGAGPSRSRLHVEQTESTHASDPTQVIHAGVDVDAFAVEHVPQDRDEGFDRLRGSRCRLDVGPNPELRATPRAPQKTDSDASEFVLKEGFDQLRADSGTAGDGST